MAPLSSRDDRNPRLRYTLAAFGTFKETERRNNVNGRRDDLRNPSVELDVALAADWPGA